MAVPLKTIFKPVKRRMMKLGMKSEWHCRITQIQSKIYCNIVKQKALKLRCKNIYTIRGRFFFPQKRKSSLVSVMDISSSGCLSFTLNYSPTVCGSHRQLLRSCPCCDLKGHNCKCDRIWASKKLTLSASYLLWRSNGESTLWVDVVQLTLWPGDVCRP